MTYESITIPLETEKQNLSKIDIIPISENMDEVSTVFNKVISTSIKPGQKISFDHFTHPVYLGYLDAYRNHRPITISPDIIWTLIVQGFSYHVKKHAEELRSKFVNFNGKKEIIIKNLNINICNATAEEWSLLVQDAINQIKECIGGKIVDILTPTFSTTTPVSSVVGQISIMSSFKNYFKYSLFCGGCGLPYVILEGSLEDWILIKTKMESLKEYKLEHWIQRLTPIINEIIETKKGNINKDFWLKMIKFKDNNGEYMAGYVDGWFTNFFLYSKKGFEVSPPFNEITSLCDEILRVPFELHIVSETNPTVVKKLKCEFMVGFVGIAQDETNKSIKPEIGWLVREETSGETMFYNDSPFKKDDDELEFHF